MLDPGNFNPNLISSKNGPFSIKVSVIGVSTDNNSGPQARTYLEIKPHEAAKMVPHSLKIQSAVSSILSAGGETAPHLDTFCLNGSKECYHIMTGLASEEELVHLAGTAVSLHYNITIIPTEE